MFQYRFARHVVLTARCNMHQEAALALPSYIDALCKEIDEKLALIRSLGLRVATVYIGGGTPPCSVRSSLSAFYLI